MIKIKILLISRSLSCITHTIFIHNSQRCCVPNFRFLYTMIWQWPFQTRRSSHSDKKPAAARRSPSFPCRFGILYYTFSIKNICSRSYCLFIIITYWEIRYHIKTEYRYRKTTSYKSCYIGKNPTKTMTIHHSFECLTS